MGLFEYTIITLFIIILVVAWANFVSNTHEIKEKPKTKTKKEEHDEYIRNLRARWEAERLERLRKLQEELDEYNRQSRQRQSHSSSYNGGYQRSRPYTPPEPSIPRAVTESFKILGLAITATEEEIKKAYRVLSLKHHPDRGGDPETFVNVTKAKNNCLKYLGKT